MGIWIVVAVWVGMAALSAKIAYGKGRDPVSWFIGGLVFPLPALIGALCCSRKPK
jgi:hypothetical protein